MNTTKVNNKWHIAVIALLIVVMTALIVVAVSLKKSTTEVGEGFFSEVEETDTAEIGIKYRVASGKALNKKKVVLPEVMVTDEAGDKVETKNNVFTPDTLGEYTITYTYTLPSGTEKILKTSLSVLDTQSPAILGMDSFETKIKAGTQLDLSGISVLDRSGEEIAPEIQVHTAKDTELTTPLSLIDDKLKTQNTDGGYVVVASAEDYSKNRAEEKVNIIFAQDNEFEFANSKSYIKKNVYGVFNGGVAWNSDPQYIFEGEGSIQFTISEGNWWPSMRFGKPSITDLSKAYALSFWVYNDSDYELSLKACRRINTDILTPHAWTKVTLTTEELAAGIPDKRSDDYDMALLKDMAEFELMYDNQITQYNATLYYDTFMVEYDEPKYQINVNPTKVVNPSKNVELDSPNVKGFEASKLQVQVIDNKGQQVTDVTYKNGRFIAANLAKGMYTVTYLYRNGIYGCTARQSLLVGEEYKTLARLSTSNGTLSVSEDLGHGTDGSYAAKYTNGQWDRWSWINIDDSDLKGLTAADAIEFWVRYEPSATADFDSLTLAMEKGNRKPDALFFTDFKTLEPGKWTKITIGAGGMVDYLATDEGLRMLLSAEGGENDFSYTLYIDDFAVVKNGNKEELDAISRYSTDNGTLSASKTIVHGKDGSIAAKYMNGQWDRWSWITIDDSDLEGLTAADAIEFWVYYEDSATGIVDSLSIVTEKESRQPDVKFFTSETKLESGKWTKISIGAAGMKEYLEADDGLRIFLSVAGDSADMSYHLYIDDFAVVKNANKEELDAISRYSTDNGTLSASKTNVHGKDGSIAAKYTNGQWDRWSWITIDDSDLEGLTAADAIEFWVYYEDSATGIVDSLSIVTEKGSRQPDAKFFTSETKLESGKWTKISIGAAGMKEYLEADDGLRIFLSVAGDSADMSYHLYIDDFAVVKNGNKEELDAISRYSTDNGTLSGSKTNVHGKDGSISAKYTNGQWDRWSWITIDDSDLDGLTAADAIEFWVYYEDSATGIVDSLSIVTEKGSRQPDAKFFTSETKLESEKWTKISIGAAGMKEYLEADDGLRMFLSVAGDSADMSYHLYIDDFRIVKDANKDMLAAIENYYIARGNMSIDASKDRVHGEDGSISAVFTNHGEETWPFIGIVDNSFKGTIEKVDAIEFWYYLERTANSGYTQISYQLESVRTGDVVATYTSREFLVEGEWTKVTLEFAAIEAYINANDGLMLTMEVTDPGTSGKAFKLYIDDFRIVEDVNKEAYSEVQRFSFHPTRPVTDLLFGASREIYHGEENDFSVQISTTVDNMWRWMKVDDTDIVATEKDAIEFWAYLESDDSANTVIWLDDLEHGSPFKIFTLPAKEWTKISMSISEMKQYLSADNGLALFVNTENASDKQFTLYIDEFKVVKDANKETYDKVQRFSMHPTMAATDLLFGLSWEVYHGAVDNFAAQISTTADNMWRWIKVDDTDIVATDKDAIEFWAYLDSDDSANTVIWLDDLEHGSPFKTFTLPAKEWTKISMSKSEMKQYLSADNGLAIFVNTENASDKQFTLYIDEFTVAENANEFDWSTVERFTPSNTVVTTNGSISGTIERVHGKDGSVAAKFMNNQWDTWPFIKIDDADLKNLTAGDQVEFWVYLERVPGSSFDYVSCGLSNLRVNASHTAFVNSFRLPENEWVKISMDATAVQKYLNTNDGLHISLSVEGGDEGAKAFNMYIDDFTVITN